MTVVAIVGSTGFPLARGAGHILRTMKDLPKGSYVYVRGSPEYAPIAGVDALVVTFAEALHLSCEVVGLSTSSAAARRGWDRDTTLVDAVDEVLAFFDPDRVMAGGTANIVNLALAKDKKVTAWTIDDEDRLVEVGTDEPAATPGLLISSSSTGPITSRPITFKTYTTTAPDGTLTVGYAFDET